MLVNEDEYLERQKKEKFLTENGLIDKVKEGFPHLNVSEEYFAFLADYFYSIYTLKNKIIDIDIAINMLPRLVEQIEEVDFNNIKKGEESSYIDGNTIYINEALPYKMKKYTFFKELTNLLFDVNYYNANDVFVKKAIVEHTTESLYNASFNKKTEFNYNYDELIGLPNHVVYSGVRNNKINEDILILLCKSMNYEIDSICSVGFTYHGREILEKLYGDQKNINLNFNGLMDLLNKIQYINDDLNNGSIDDFKDHNSVKTLKVSDTYSFDYNLDIYNNLLLTVERELINQFINNRSKEALINDSKYFIKYLTTEELKKEFRDLVSKKVYGVSDLNQVHNNNINL